MNPKTWLPSSSPNQLASYSFLKECVATETPHSSDHSAKSSHSIP
jgi:hypothetical protein